MTIFFLRHKCVKQNCCEKDISVKPEDRSSYFKHLIDGVQLYGLCDSNNSST